MSQCGNNDELALQHGGFCTTWSLAAKGLFDETRRARWSRLIFSICASLSNRNESPSPSGFHSKLYYSLEWNHWVSCLSSSRQTHTGQLFSMVIGSNFRIFTVFPFTLKINDFSSCSWITFRQKQKNCLKSWLVRWEGHRIEAIKLK